VLVSRSSKPETQSVSCGERSFHGRIEILHNGQRLEAHTNSEDEASIDAGNSVAWQPASASSCRHRRLDS